MRIFRLVSPTRSNVIPLGILSQGMQFLWFADKRLYACDLLSIGRFLYRMANVAYRIEDGAGTCFDVETFLNHVIGSSLYEGRSYTDKQHFKSNGLWFRRANDINANK